MPWLQVRGWYDLPVDSIEALYYIKCIDDIES